MFGKKGSNGMVCVGCGSCVVCRLLAAIIMLLAVLGVVASLVGLYKSILVGGTAVFGSSNVSLALVSLALNLFLLRKAAECCPCRMEK